jgi:3-oxoadipate enol-lactonase
MAEPDKPDVEARDAFDRGLSRRREVLGREYVDRSLANATDFTRDFQSFITRYAWDDIWNRPGLDTQTRRLLVIAFTLALGKWEEFELHFRAALEHGVPVETLKEVLLQSAIYCGVPAANAAFKRAQALVEASYSGAPSGQRA